MTRYGWFVVIAGFALLLRPPPAAGGAKVPIVAVFDMEAKRVKGIGPEVLKDLSDHLATLLTSSGRYQVVPRSELRARLQKQKVQSYKECVDQSCQVALGRELAAEKTLSSSVMKLGDKCMVNLTLYDLRKAATEKAASHRAGCKVDDVLDSVEKAAAKLVGSAVAQPAGSGSARIVADVKGAKVLIDGEPKGFSPLTVTGLATGQHLARVEADGRKPWQQTFSVQGGQQTMVVAELATKKRKKSFKDRFAGGLGTAVGIGADVVGVTVDTAKDVHKQATDDEPDDSAPAPYEIRQPDGKATWLRCPVGQTWEDEACTGLATKMPFYKARSACPTGFKLPLAQDLTGLLGGCDADVNAGKDGDCSSCSEGACAQVFDDADGRYWTFSTDLATGKVRTVDLDGDVKFEKPDEKFQVLCIRRR